MGHVTILNVRDVMTYQKPNEEQMKKYENIKEYTINLIIYILENVPDCADRTTAIRKVREACMDANSAIALDGKI